MAVGGFSLQWLLLLQSTGSRRKGALVVAQGPRCPAARGFLVPRPGVKPEFLALRARSPNHLTAREFQAEAIF